MQQGSSGRTTAARRFPTTRRAASRRPAHRRAPGGRWMRRAAPVPAPRSAPTCRRDGGREAAIRDAETPGEVMSFAFYSSQSRQYRPGRKSDQEAKTSGKCRRISRVFLARYPGIPCPPIRPPPARPRPVADTPRPWVARVAGASPTATSGCSGWPRSAPRIGTWMQKFAQSLAHLRRSRSSKSLSRARRLSGPAADPALHADWRRDRRPPRSAACC